jgi:hypothetical protein
LGREQIRKFLLYLFHKGFHFLICLSFRELIEMLAISRNQKLLQPGEENQVSDFFFNLKGNSKNDHFCKFPNYSYFVREQEGIT